MNLPSISFPMFGEDFILNPPDSINPFGFPIYWYGIIIATGFLLAVLYCMKRSPEFGLDSDNVIDLLIFAVPLAIVGARLYYVVFNFAMYENDLMSIFNIRKGGLAIYGGVIFAVIGLMIASRRKGFSAAAMADLGSLGLLIGQSVGRWGNFINREAFGGETDVFCRMGLTYPDSGATIYVHPTFLYESVWNLIGLVILHIFTKKTERKFDGQIFLMYIGWYGLGRMFIEGLRTDSLYIGAFRVSQLLAFASLLFAVIALIIMLKRDNSPENLWKNKKFTL